jgi:hypothetical protein
VQISAGWASAADLTGAGEALDIPSTLRPHSAAASNSLTLALRTIVAPRVG